MAAEYSQTVDTVPMDIIMREWLKGYSSRKPNQEIVGKEWYYDPAKGTVVVVLNIKEEV